MAYFYVFRGHDLFREGKKLDRKTRPKNLHNKSQHKKKNKTKKNKKTKRKQNCSTIKANKFHRTADTITTQKANKVETPRIEFKGLITTNRGAPKQIKTDHIAGKFWWKLRNKQRSNGLMRETAGSIDTGRPAD